MVGSPCWRRLAAHPAAGAVGAQLLTAGAGACRAWSSDRRRHHPGRCSAPAPGAALAVYVSGDSRSTAERLLLLGVAPALVVGDSCARTTWENATRTAAWLRQHHPGAPVLLITDPWQLPRATRAFARQGLQVHPLAAEPALTPQEHNRLALREAAATLLYRLQGRI
ncbi:YdcF family protein [Synechococcus sp. CCY9202]|uniref:YdcF family protein n=1 Tax=Synechococcus sp. CCY9202 TaxID=174698 RepID=UPI002B1FA1F5|nr:YdcF family protein [Synechococcus sp. CCY9202]MEA5423750.1 YdcF family protein [Synechococcus sp. CCY9202]